jgi:hypothetical protein
MAVSLIVPKLLRHLLIGWAAHSPAHPTEEAQEPNTDLDKERHDAAIGCD